VFWRGSIVGRPNPAPQRNDRFPLKYARPLIPGETSYRKLGFNRWRAAVYLGLISSTFSTVVSQLTAARIGRDAAVDWMSVAAIPARDWALTAEPSMGAIAAGIAFHQWADFSWALVFFGLFGKCTANLSPVILAVAALPWAILTSALEWFILVPLFPFWQPIFALQQPYWIGFLVHLSSASMYPLFAWLRRSAAERKAFEGKTFLRVWSLGAISGIMVLEAGALFAAHDRELPWTGADPSIDQTFMRHMSSHHDQGVLLASIAAERAGDPHLRALSMLMVASQRGEARILAHWWASWFEQSMQICSAEERASMPGLLDPADIARLRSLGGPAFDQLFVELMTRHHKGAVAMANSELRDGSDLRLRLMAHAIRHEQQGEIALMQGVNGERAVRLAFQNMLADNVNTHRNGTLYRKAR
jgi:uncharacterized protein (DUF305 family)